MIKNYLTYINENVNIYKEHGIEVGDIVRVKYRKPYTGLIGKVIEIVYPNTILGFCTIRCNNERVYAFTLSEVELIKKFKREITPEDPYGEEDWEDENENIKWLERKTIDIGEMFKKYWHYNEVGWPPTTSDEHLDYYMSLMNDVQKLNDLLTGKLVKYDNRERVVLIKKVSLGSQSFFLHCSDMGVRDAFDTITIVGDPETYDGYWAGKVKTIINDEDPYGEEDWGDEDPERMIY
jgi:hypothetical protein